MNVKINNVTISGRLTKDIELRYTQSGTATATLSLAFDRSYKDQIRYTFQ